jgi:hypothetical protein
MSDGGKGSKPRPFSVSQEEYDNRWDAIFGKKKKTEAEKFDEAINKDEYYDLESEDKKEVKITAIIPDIKIKGSI